jgi:hypothetical protein
MNSRIEVNFTATSGQTTFTTPYEVGQIDVYYNGSKLNPSEFTATNGTTVVLAQAATLNAQISIVKYIGSINGVSGTADRVAKFTGTVTLGDSQITDNGTNVGIGITTPNSKLDVANNDRVNGSTLSITNSADSSGWVAGDIIGSIDFRMDDTSNAQKIRGQIKVINTTTGPFTYPSTNAMTFSTASVSTLSEHMRITAAGRVGIGQNNPGFKLDVIDNGTAYVARFYNVNSNNAGGTGCLYLQGGTFNSSDTTTNMISFRRNDGTEIGSIKRNGATTVSYNTSSDYRLKEDLKEFNGLDKISAIKVYDFQWVDTDERNYGVLAHELKDVVDYSVSGEKDEIDDDGKILAQSVDYSKLVPILIKSIQEQQELIQELTARLEILENK